MDRESLRSKDYYKKYIVDQKKRIDKFKDALEKIDENDGTKVNQCNRILANLYKDLFVAGYSYGLSKGELMGSFVEYSYFVKKSSIDGYGEMIDILSIGILLDCQEEIEWINDIESYEDSLTKGLKVYLFGHRSGNSFASNLKYPDYYQAFADFLDGAISTSDFLNYVADEWYDSSVDMAWYNRHLSKEDIYVGYWCWLAAAVLKIKECALSCIKYVPSDLI